MEKIPNINDEVLVLCGALNGKQGRVIEAGNKAVKLQLPSLGYHLVAEVPFEKLRDDNT